ncbi:acyltransferase family protein [Microbacterium oleivorans]|uniref:Acyltransferase n=1 Tax=Microbacterium oleivorans TaxID=273677 RepID=A0A7D5EY69_9MICO|nr:acyltransferase family protein [Microbacterium oleivorans]QLD12564.1 acyltransferase [Microbacterium oleivorans]
MSQVELPRRTRRRPAATEWRADIDGLRAFAIVLVVVYHVWLGRVSGGVDVFLLVSAYFLTASFLRRSDGLRPSDLPVFWFRRFARLLPAAAVTIFAVLGFTAAALPGSQWRTVWSQSWASLFYVQNRELADSSVDYYARTETFPSILQHFWSLSVQGQVFLLWPVIILVSVLIARALRRSARLVLGVVFAAVFVVSFLYSTWLVGADQQVAYFSTPARLWEFALGSLAALLLPSLRLPRWAAAALGWGGIVALVTCGIVLDVGAGFPGVAALWPTLAAMAIIAAGQTEKPAAASSARFLASRPLAAVGKIAYSLYLVHWPILIGYMTITDSTDVGIGGGVVVIALSVAAAFVLHRAVEQPAGRMMAGVRRNAALMSAAVLLVAVPLGSWQLADSVRAATANPENNPGAAVLMPWLGAIAADDAPVVPTSTQLDDEWVEVGRSCTGSRIPDQPLVAESCLENDVVEGAPTLLILGDSHAQQWIGMFLPILDEANWNLVAVMKGGCAFAPGEAGDEDCVAWRTEAAEYAEAADVDVVAVVGTKAISMSPEERVPYGLDTVVDSIAASGSQVILLRDNPRFDFDMYRCWEAEGSESCAVPVGDVLAAENPAQALTREGSVFALDLTEYICPDGLCNPVVGNVAVFLDDNHLTGTYAATLAPAGIAALREMPGVPLG